jgi:hypothetical protein
MRALLAAVAVLALGWAQAGWAAPAPLASSRYGIVEGEKGEARLARYLTGTIDKAAPRAARVAGVERVTPVRIILYRSGLHPGANAGAPVGTASYPDQTIRLDVSLLDVRQIPGVVSHEIIHVMTMRAAAPNYDAVPRWFAEGVAVYVEGRSRWRVDSDTQTAEREGIEAPLTDLDAEFIRSDSQDPGQQHAAYAYAKSASVVYFLVGRFGKGVIASLLAAVHRQGDFAAALKEVTGLTEEDLEARWRASLRHAPPPWIALLDPNLLMWAVMALLLVAAAVRYWIVRRRRAAEPEEDTAEPPERRPLGW